MSSAPAPREPGGEQYRLFIAVPTPQPVRDAARAAIDALRGLGDVRWVTPERMHLTLKFLGAVPEAELPEIMDVVSKNANTFSPVVVDLSRVSAFPNVRRPQTLWLGLDGEGTAILTALAEDLDRRLEPLGFPREKKAFRPHVTLGRVRSPRGLAELASGLTKMPAAAPISWRMNELQLVRSVLGPSGPDYTVLRQFFLKTEE